ncbi:MAG: S8 family serine peptidase [Alphaproteobacteria bacterium]|nr:S8 family serine peptidase [Alphaproteobacteria bacterium]
MFLHLLSGVLLVSPAAHATPGLRLDPRRPPVAVGGDRYAFPRRVDAPDASLRVLPGVVLHLSADGAAPPGAEHLGGRSWRLPVADAATAVQVALSWEARPGVTAFPDVELPLRRTQDVPGSTDPRRGGQWYLDDLSYDELLAVWPGDPDTRVAVIDSGIDISHGDLAAAVDAPYDAYDDDDDPSPDPGEFCAGATGICDVHGTAVSGVMVARADNGLGIVGMCPECTLVPIKLLGEGGVTNTLSRDVRAFEHAIAQDVAVINNSWGFTESIPVPATLAEVIERAATEPRGGKGALVVFAAGNDDRVIEDDELQALDDVLCVSAVDSYGNPTNYTNYGATIDVAAPSATVTIAPGDEVIDNFGGTSAAAPVASGLASWAASVDPSLTAAELHALLVDAAVPSPLVSHDESGHNDFYGYGLIDAVAVKDAVWTGGADSGAETPGGCGCSGLPTPAVSWLLALPALIALRRRR